MLFSYQSLIKGHAGWGSYGSKRKKSLNILYLWLFVNKIPGGPGVQIVVKAFNQVTLSKEKGTESRVFSK